MMHGETAPWGCAWRNVPPYIFFRSTSPKPRQIWQSYDNQTSRASGAFERRGFPYLKTIKFRCSSLVGRAGGTCSKHTGEFHSGNDREGNHRSRLKIYKPHGKYVAVTTRRFVRFERQKIHTHRPLNSYKLESKFRHGVTITRERIVSGVQLVVERSLEESPVRPFFPLSCH